jgi:uncharacterized beta-barrel protein YwiB (DUF1934 family)
MKDVIITVKTVQIKDEDKETMELTSEGRFGEKDGAYLITYTDSMMSDEYGKVSTGIKLSKDNTVTISRSGAYNSKFRLEKGKRCNSLYSTPFGVMTMGFFGEEIRSNLTENGGTLELKYTVDVNNSEVNKNEIYITVRDL